MADDIKIVADYTDLQLMRRELLGVGKDAKASASVFEREFAKVERQLVKQEKEFRKNAVASQNFYNQLLGVDRATKSAAASASVFERELKKVEASTRRAAVAQKTFENTSRKGMRNTEVIAQQAGYQIGDLAVQIQGGTNAAVAFGQQGSQLLGFFGPAGALAGAALAITTAFIAPLLGAKKEARDLNKELESTREALSWLDSNKQVINDSITAPITLASRELKGFVADLNRLRFEEVSKGLKSGVLSIVSPLEKRIKGLEGSLARTIENGTKQIKTLQNAGKDVNEDPLVIAYRKRIDEIFNKIKALKQVSGSLAMGTIGEDADELQANMLKAVQEIKDAGYWTSALEKEVYSVMEAAGLSTRAMAEIAKVLEEGSKNVLVESTVRANEFYDVALAGQKELNDEAADLGTRLGLSFGVALELIRQAKAEASVDLDAFGGYGSFAYGAASKFTPPKKTKVRSTKQDPLESLRKQVRLQESLVGKTQAQQRLIQALGVDYEKVYGKSATEDLIERINKLREVQEEEAKIADLAQTIGSSMEDAFMSMVDGTKSVKDAFRDMAKDIVAHLFKVLVVQQAINSFGGMLSGSSNPIVSKIGGALESYEGGGYTGNGPRSGGVDGRGGRLAVIHPKETVVDHTKGGSAGGVVVNQTFNFSANGDDSVKKLIAQAAPQIAQMTQKQIIDSRRRGGTMKSTFG